MDGIKHKLVLILLGLIPLHLYSQEKLILGHSYPEQPLVSLLQELQEDEGVRFYFDSSWIDSIRTPAIRQGSGLEEVIKSALQGTGLSFYMEYGHIFIFRGDDLVTEFPHFEHTPPAASDPVGSAGEQQPGEEVYLTTKGLSEKRFLQIGARENAKPGQSCRVQGHVSNNQGGEALIGATIFIKETSKGTISDVDGNFQLNLAPGTYSIIVDHMAMKEAEYGLNVLSDGDLVIGLENDLFELQEITVTEKRHSNVGGMYMGYERISVKSMKEVPVVLGEKDVLKVAQLLPGVQNAGEGSSGFNVRGGSADQNMFYINKISIYNTSHMFGFFTAFSPDIVSDFSLYKTNVPSKYGGRIASIFDIATRPGNKDHLFAQGGISPITAHLAVEGPIVKEKVSFVASARSTYSDWILKRLNDYDLRQSEASFNDFTLGFDARINPNNRANLFLYRSSDRFSLSAKNNYRYSNTGGSISWDHSFSKTFSSEFSVSTSNYQFSTTDKNNVSEAYSHDYYLRHTEARADFLLLKLDGHRIEFGVNTILYDLNRGEILPYGEESNREPLDLGREQGNENALYVSDEFELLPKLNLLLGLRYSFYGLLGPADINEYEEGQPKNKYNYIQTTHYSTNGYVKSYSGLEPRAAVNYQVGAYSSLKASYNRLRQYVFLLSNTIAIAPNDQWKLTDYHITPPVSDQLSLGFYHDFRKPRISLSVEFYKKWVNNIVEYKDGADFISPEPLETQILQGFQDSRGVELMVKKNSKKLTGWLSYTYSRSTITIDGAYDEEKVNNGLPYPSNFDKPHSFNLVSNFRISRRLSISSNVVYSTGRPVTLPVATYFAEDQAYMLYSSRNAYRIPDYFRIDLSVNLEGNLKFKKFAHSFWMLNIYNLTGRDNAYSVYYEVVDNQVKGNQLSIFAMPIVTLSWNVKLGNHNSD